MPKNKAGAIEGPEKKKQKMAQNGAAPMEVDIDEDLHSRQLAVYGKESMRKMAAASVLVCGAKGLGIEVGVSIMTGRPVHRLSGVAVDGLAAKNVVLAGVKAVTIHDKEMVDQRDLGSQFYLTDEDVGKNRAESCRAKIQELNNGVVVSASSADLTNDFLAQFQVVVLTDSSLDEAKRVDEFCHASGVAFIKAETRGVFGSIFCDFGPSFTVIDPDGEEPHSGIIASILKGNPTLITCVDDERLEFQEGDLVTFSEVQGMTELCGCKPVRVTKAKPQSLEVDLDSRGFGEYTRGGIVTQVKVPKTLSFRTLAASLEQPGEFLLSDFSKLERPQLLHLAFQALDAFQVKNGHLPRTRSDEDANALIALVKELNASLQDSIDLDEDVLRQFSFVAAGEINPMGAMFGGVVGQEVVKAASGKFTPICQWLYFDAAEALPTGDLPAEEFAPEGSRYDAQIAVFGRTMQRKLADLRLFLVGAGALGCEFLKNFALMGIACGGSGEVTVTDDDTIEKSNLSRQFLFRDWDIGSPKSTVAAHAAQKINPGFQVKPLQNRVSPETEELFNDDFWQSLSMVVNALDNVNARLYVDARCVYFGKGLLESGTLGPKCNTQMVVPWVSENYGASRDPPEKQAPMCTLHSFPHNIDHCLTWARSEFEGLLEQAPSECNAYLNNPAQYAQTVRDARDAVARQQLEKVVNLLVDERCSTFDECIAWARHRFQDFFYNRVAQLTFTFPEGATTSNGLPFWSAPKRFPTAVQFDGSDPLHQAFVQAGAILQAGVFGIPVPEYASSLEEMGTRGARVAVVAFTPKEGVKIETDPNAKSAGPASSGDDDSVIEKLLSQLEAKQAGADAAYRLNPVVFEKDDDTNYHIDFISALANMRARCYKIQEVDKLKCKFIAGRIIPAIATATSVATGLVCLELYKVIQQKKLEAYRNTFANLAIPLFAMAEPIAPKVTKYKDMEWTLWDRWSIEGDLTVQEVLDWMAAKGLVTYSISYGPSLLYNNIFKKHEERLGMKVSELLRTKAALPPHKKYCDIVVACEDEEGEDVDVPLVSLKFR